MTDPFNLYDAKTNLSNWWTAPPPARRSSSPKQASRKPSWFPISRPGKAAVLGRTCLVSRTLPMISTDLCHLKYRNISSRIGAAADRHAHPALGG